MEDDGFDEEWMLCAAEVNALHQRSVEAPSPLDAGATVLALDAPKSIACACAIAALRLAPFHDTLDAKTIQNKLMDVCASVSTDHALFTEAVKALRSMALATTDTSTTPFLSTLLERLGGIEREHVLCDDELVPDKVPIDHIRAWRIAVAVCVFARVPPAHVHDAQWQRELTMHMLVEMLCTCLQTTNVVVRIAALRGVFSAATRSVQNANTLAATLLLALHCEPTEMRADILAMIFDLAHLYPTILDAPSVCVAYDAIQAAQAALTDTDAYAVDTHDDDMMKWDDCADAMQTYTDLQRDQCVSVSSSAEESNGMDVDEQSNEAEDADDDETQPTLFDSILYFVYDADQMTRRIATLGIARLLLGGTQRGSELGEHNVDEALLQLACAAVTFADETDDKHDEFFQQYAPTHQTSIGNAILAAFDDEVLHDEQRDGDNVMAAATYLLTHLKAKHNGALRKALQKRLESNTSAQRGGAIRTFLSKFTE